jgi:transcriptional regulator with XRE-family HTH domain
MAGPRPAGYNWAVQTKAFGGELRRWRDSRRWSQLELALRAGTTQRHVSFLESGRSAPGRPLVLRLAESMGLSLRERNALLGAAGYAPVYTESRWDDPALRPVRRALDGVLAGHLPYPAVVVGAHGELVAANDALEVLTEGAAAELLVPPVNVWRLALHPRGLASRVGNLASWGRHVVETLRARALRSPDPVLDELLAELTGYLPPAEPDPEYLGFAVPVRLAWRGRELRLLTALTSFATAVDVTLAELHLEAWLPADEATADALRERPGRVVSAGDAR